ncbi:mannose-1-phosphate guanylyltransferase/mannose-6-phosphate isomerase [Campylobacter jejuni]|uniref:mannose-1-phosphate guanylyltransferase/mannose-6-phosphate isomerase n=1 Tax=Campylobacter jejuni TaxID=197 RepID=UPI003B9FDAC4
MVNIILCGGKGTRLWPLSTNSMPKQFIKFFNDKSLFMLTLERNVKLCSDTIVVTSEQYYYLALEQSNGKKIRYILEPNGKNTAASITLACLTLPKDEIVLVTPSDHLIKDNIAYNNAILEAENMAKYNNIIIFGIKPNYPEVDYGYINFKNNDVLNFYEKPKLDSVLKFIQDENYLWNSGMFVCRVDFLLEQISQHAPNIYKSCEKAYDNALKTDNTIRIKADEMFSIPSNSIDYALLEKTKDIKIIPCNFNWNDLGSFRSLSKEFKTDESGNYCNTINSLLNSKNNFIYSTCKEKNIIAIDIEDCFIIDTNNTLLVGKKESSARVKEIYEKITFKERDKLVYRPWGKFTVLDQGQGYKIKKIEVIPGKRLSLQKHFYRSEYWTVLSGVATVEVDGIEKLIGKDESINIKVGQIHRLSNKGKMPLILIEIQIGQYTEEDDIIRLDDDYSRVDVK